MPAPMLLRKNFLQPIMSRTFRQMVATGLLLKWEQLTFQNVISARVKNMHENRSSSYILGKQEANSRFSKANSNIASVPLESMKYFFFVFLLFLGFALVVELVENCISK